MNDREESFYEMGSRKGQRWRHVPTGDVITLTGEQCRTCRECGNWITGALDIEGEPLILLPCEHQADYRNVCPSWGPVDGCKCQPGEHASPPLPDGRP